MAKIGVFTCWCGENIARNVDVDRVSEAISKLPGVACSMNYKYMCSEPGQSLIASKIHELGLTGVVVASCSPHMHLKTFRKMLQLHTTRTALTKPATMLLRTHWNGRRKGA